MKLAWSEATPAPLKYIPPCFPTLRYVAFQEYLQPALSPAGNEMPAIHGECECECVLQFSECHLFMKCSF